MKMKENEMEERLRQLPQIAGEMDIHADEKLKYRILRAAEEKKPEPKTKPALRVLALACAAVVVLGAAATALPGLTRPAGPAAVNETLTAVGTLGRAADMEDAVLTSDLSLNGVNFSISGTRASAGLWEGGNSSFPLIGVNGRYYRMLTQPQAEGGLAGEELGKVDQFTNEPALADENGLVSNAVSEGETVYAVRGMKGAAVTAKVNGVWRVFQRVSFGNSGLIGSESLKDALGSLKVTGIKLSDAAAIKNAQKAQELVSLLESKAIFLRSGSSESNRFLLIQFENGLMLQLAVNGDRLIGCGTWSCPEFFHAYEEALQ